MLSWTKAQVLTRYSDAAKDPPSWVIDAPDDAMFAAGFDCSDGMSYPLHIRRGNNGAGFRGVSISFVNALPVE